MNILVAEPGVYTRECLSLLGEMGEVWARRMTREELLRAVPRAHILMVGFQTRVDREFLERGEELKIIGSPTTGLDHIDVDYAQSQGIEVISLRGATELLKNVSATAEHTFALLLALIRKIPWAFDAVRSQVWSREEFFGRELKGKTMGIIGLGRLGAKVARIARGFGMKVMAFDPQVGGQKGAARLVELRTLLAQSDIISIHAPLYPQTENMISYVEFKLMHKRPIIINTSRGRIMSEDALLQALQSGLISGAALDVLNTELEAEPLHNHPLVQYAREHQNLLITPHLGGATEESMRMTQLYIGERVREAAAHLFPAGETKLI